MVGPELASFDGELVALASEYHGALERLTGAGGVRVELQGAVGEHRCSEGREDDASFNGETRHGAGWGVDWNMGLRLNDRRGDREPRVQVSRRRS